MTPAPPSPAVLATKKRRSHAHPALISYKTEHGIDWPSYKALCDRPDVLSRWMLTETAALLPHESCSAVLAVARRRPIPRPSDHKGGEDTDMFEVVLPLATLESILDIVDCAARRGLSTPRSTHIGHFATAWRELRDWQVANRV